MERIHRTAACQFAGEIIQESIIEEAMGNVGKGTPSVAMETGCHGKNPSDCRESVIILYENYPAAIVLSRSQFPYNCRIRSIQSYMYFITQGIGRFLASNCVTE